MSNGTGNQDTSMQVDPGQKGGRRGSERADIKSPADVRQLLKTTIVSLTFMSMMFGIGKNTGSKMGKFLVIYSTLVLIALVGDFGWRLSKSNEMDLIVSMQGNIWTFQAIVHFIIFYTASIRPTGASTFFDKWQGYRNKYFTGSGSLKCQSNICTAVLWILTILSAIFTGYQAFSGFATGDIDVPKLILIFISWSGAFYNIFAWIASSGFLFLIANLLAKEYRPIYKEIQEAAEGGPHILNQRIGDIRRRHWELCKVVSKADDILCAHVGTSFLASLVLSCLGLYIMIWSKAHDGTVVVIQGIWSLMALIKLTSDCVAGIILHDSVRTIYAPCTRIALCISGIWRVTSTNNHLFIIVYSFVLSQYVKALNLGITPIPGPFGIWFLRWNSVGRIKRRGIIWGK